MSRSRGSACAELRRIDSISRGRSSILDPLWLAGVFVLVCGWAHAAERQRPSNAEIHFRLDNPCPSTGETRGACPGYVVDRVIPVVCGGADDPHNMQWQTLAEAREKDRWERIGCRAGRKLVLPRESTSFTEAYATGEQPRGVEAQPLPK